MSLVGYSSNRKLKMFSKKKRLKKNMFLFLKRLEKLSTFLNSSLSNTFLYLVVYIQLFEKYVLDSKKRLIDLFFNNYLKKDKFVNSMEETLLTNIWEYVYLYINTPIDYSLTLNKEYLLYEYNHSFFFNNYFLHRLFLQIKKKLYTTKTNIKNVFLFFFFSFFDKLMISYLEPLHELLNSSKKNGHFYSYSYSYSYSNINSNSDIRFYNSLSNCYIYYYNQRWKGSHVLSSVLAREMFDMHFYVQNTSIRQHLNYDVFPFYLQILKNYIRKRHYILFCNVIICFLIWFFLNNYWKQLRKEEDVVFGNYKKEVILYYLSD